MAADDSTGRAPRQDFQLDFGQYHPNADNNLPDNGNPQAIPNDNEVMMDLGSSSESSTKPSVNQVDFSISFSVSSTPTSPLLLENFQFSSSSSDESSESSTPQSSPTSTDEDEMLEVGINEIAHSTFVLRTNHRCHLKNETMINLTTDVNAPNMMRVEVETPNSGPLQAEMAVQNAGMQVQPSLQHHHEPQSIIHAEILQPQMVDPSSQSSSFYGNHFGMNIQHNNMNSSFGDQAHFYPPPYSQTTMGTMDGRSSWNNHQQPWFSGSYNTTPQRPMNTTPSGPRYNYFMRANSFSSNGASLQSRPVQPPIWHQVPAASNTYDPYYHYTVAPAPPVYPRFQSFYYQYHHQASMAPNVYDRQGWNFMPPPETSFQARPQSFARHQVPYGNGMNPHNYNSLLPGPSMPSSSRFQQFNGYNQHLNSANYGLSNVSDPPNYINPRQEPLLLTGPPQATDVQQEMMITHGSQNQQQQFSMVPEAPTMNSFRSQQLVDAGEANVSIEAMAQLPDPLHDTSGSSVNSKPWINEQHQILISEAQEEGVRGWQSHRRTHFELGESSSSTAKRIKRETTTTDASPLAVSLGRAGVNTSGGAQHSEGPSRFAHPRQIKSEIYDPKFEEMGLPIDPHLRMFMLNN